MQLPSHRTWGHALALLERSRRFRWIDLLILAGFAGAVAALVDFGHRWGSPLRTSIEIDLDSPWTLLHCTLYSLARGLTAYVISLAFTLVYGYWAAKDHIAERLLVPLLDILQSIPVLSF